MNKIKIVFRLDDPSAISPIEIENNLIDILCKHEVTFTFAIIPNVTLGNFRESISSGNALLPKDKIQLFKKGADSNVIDIALHGFEHKTISKNGDSHTEFRGDDLGNQIKKIREGKKILEDQIGLPITTFIPPWNTYDENTINALRENNITCISSNRYQPAGNKNSISYLPITIELPDLKSAVEITRKADTPDPVIIVLLHPYDFTESGDDRAKYGCNDVDKLLSWVGAQQDLEVRSISQLTKKNNEYDYTRYIWNKASFLENIYPPSLLQTEDTPIYHTTVTAKYNKIKNAIITLAFFTLLIVLSALFTYGVFNKVLDSTAIISNSLLYSLIFIIVLLGAKAIKQKSYYFRSFLLTNFALGAIIGLGLM